MANDDLCFLSIAELGSLMRARTVSPVEVTEAHLARTERLNPTLNAFVTIMATQEVTFTSGLAMRQEVNVVGLPAVAVPIGFGETGLPLSMQIVGPAWAEAKILRIAHAYEVATLEIRSRRPTALTLVP